MSVPKHRTSVVYTAATGMMRRKCEKTRTWTYARVEADGLGIHAQVAELNQLLELDWQGRHDAGYVIVPAVL